MGCNAKSSEVRGLGPVLQFCNSRSTRFLSLDEVGSDKNCELQNCRTGPQKTP